MEMKFAKFRKDERCKKLERSLKLALLRKCGKVVNDEQMTPSSIYTSMSSINTDTQDFNCTTSSAQISHMKNEIVSSSNNLQNVLAKKKNRYTIHDPIVASSSIKQSVMQKDRFDGKTASSLLDVNKFPNWSKADLKILKRDLLKNGDYSLSQMENNSCLLSTNKESASNNVNHFQSHNENAENNDNDNNGNCSPPQLAINNIKKGGERTFFNWRVILNEDGQLLIKGMLENGKVARSKPIVARLTATSVQSIFKHTYRLEGNIVDHRNELPEYVRGKFYSGFPDDWQNVHQVWVLYVSQGSRANFHWPTKITDSDEDITSIVTDLTFLSTKRDENQYHKSDIISKVEKLNVPSAQISSSGVCSNNWKRHTSEAEIDNASNFGIHVPNLKNISISNVVKKAHDHEVCDKENQCQQENVNTQKWSFLQKGAAIKDIIQEDKINIIINNLLHTSCPEEYILKIMQMFDRINDVFSYKIDTDKSNCKSDNKESGLYSEQVKDNESKINSKRFSIPEHRDISPLKEYIDRKRCNGNMRKISSRIVQGLLEDRCNIPEKMDDMLVRRCEKKNTDELESETYAGVPKVISDRILEHARKDSLKRVKRKQESKMADVKPKIQSNVKLRKKFKKDRKRIIYPSNSSDSDIENDKRYFAHEDEKKGGGQKKTMVRESVSYRREVSDNVDLNSSVSITEDEELRKEEKLDCARVSGRRERDNLKYNHMHDVSSTDDEMELPKWKHKKHLNAKEAIKHSAKKPKIVNNNNDNMDSTTYTLHRTNENNVRSTHSSIVKHDILGNRAMNANQKDTNNDESRFLSPLSNKKERNGDTRKSNLGNTLCSNDDQINGYEANSKVSRVPRMYEFQMESDKAPEGVKFAMPQKLPVRADESLQVSKSKSSFFQYSEIEIADNSTGCKKVIQAHGTDNKTLGRAVNSSIELSSMEQYKSLSAWVPRVVYDSKPICEIGLVFEGKLLNEAGHVIHRKFVTEFVHRRLSPTLIETTNGECYRLVGDLHDPKHVVPKEILKHCRNGCPSDINEFCKAWKSLLEGNASKAASKQKDAIATDVVNVHTSSRGRKRYPSLNYWAGERVALKNDELLYTTTNYENLPMNSSTKTANGPSNFQERNKLDEHSKNVEATRTNTANATFDIKGRFNKADRDDDATSRLDERKKKRNSRERSPIKKQNVFSQQRYTYYRSIPRRDDILSDDQVSQL